MPLRAVVDGNDVIAPFLSLEEWERLRASVKSREKELRLPCCQNTGHLRTSKLGTNHFVHNRRAGCDWISETVAHLKAKSEIALVCKEFKYDVTTEASGSGWRADVLATKGSTKIAFEVQWSRQSLEETARRQAQYRRDGIRGCWLFRLPPQKMKRPARELPLFALSSEQIQNDLFFKVKISTSVNEVEPQPSHVLSDFIRSLLGRKVKFCKHFTAKKHQRLRIVFIYIKCWRCQKFSHVYYISNGLLSCCGDTMHKCRGMWDLDKLKFNEAVLQAIRAFLHSPEGSHIRMGEIKPRYYRTLGEIYPSFGCYHCDVILGDWFISEAVRNSVYNENFAPGVLESVITLPHPPPSEPGGHWCFSSDREFCE